MEENKRIIEDLAAHYNITVAELAKSIGKNPTNLYDIQRGKIKAISHRLASTITEKYPEINKVWLLTGTGSMLVQKEEAQNESFPHKETIHERIKILVDRFSDGNNTEFAKKIDTNEANIRGYIKNIQPKADVLARIVNSFGINPLWLLTGEGTITKNDLPQVPVHRAFKSTDRAKGIPLLPISAMAGAFTIDESILEYDCERYIVPAFGNADFLIHVKGDSMLPTYHSGDIVACKKVPMNNFFFQWNKTYVLDTDQGPLLKRIQSCKKKDHIFIVSDNKDYKPFALHLSHIHGVAIIKGLIRIE